MRSPLAAVGPLGAFGDWLRRRAPPGPAAGLLRGWYDRISLSIAVDPVTRFCDDVGSRPHARSRRPVAAVLPDGDRVAARSPSGRPCSGYRAPLPSRLSARAQVRAAKPGAGHPRAGCRSRGPRAARDRRISITRCWTRDGHGPPIPARLALAAAVRAPGRVRASRREAIAGRGSTITEPLGDVIASRDGRGGCTASIAAGTPAGSRAELEDTYERLLLDAAALRRAAHAQRNRAACSRLGRAHRSPPGAAPCATLEARA